MTGIDNIPNTVPFRPKVHTRDLFILPTIIQNRHKSGKN